MKERDCCVEALLKSAVEFGIITSYPKNHATLPNDEAGCGSHYAARKVLDLCAQQRGLNQQGTFHLERIWQSVLADVEQYKRDTALVHERDAFVQLSASECSKMAPVVFDILLQKLIPYI